MSVTWILQAGSWVLHATHGLRVWYSYDTLFKHILHASKLTSAAELYSQFVQKPCDTDFHVGSPVLNMAHNPVLGNVFLLHISHSVVCVFNR